MKRRQVQDVNCVCLCPSPRFLLFTCNTHLARSVFTVTGKHPEEWGEESNGSACLCVCVALCFVCVCVCGVVSRFFVCCTSNPYHHFQTRGSALWHPLRCVSHCLSFSLYLSFINPHTHTPTTIGRTGSTKKRRNAIKMFLSFTCFLPSLIPSLNLFERQNHLSSPKKKAYRFLARFCSI